uniref:Uncharacterized protein n=1 Tax=Tetraselmis sp. GSL018 TaxID=582737 RepID=A0A061RVB5_9CHLO
MVRLMWNTENGRVAHVQRKSFVTTGRAGGGCQQMRVVLESSGRPESSELILTLPRFQASDMGVFIDQTNKSSGSNHKLAKHLVRLLSRTGHCVATFRSLSDNSQGHDNLVQKAIDAILKSPYVHATRKWLFIGISLGGPKLCKQTLNPNFSCCGLILISYPIAEAAAALHGVRVPLMLMQRCQPNIFPTADCLRALSDVSSVDARLVLVKNPDDAAWCESINPGLLVDCMRHVVQTVGEFAGLLGSGSLQRCQIPKLAAAREILAHSQQGFALAEQDHQPAQESPPRRPSQTGLMPERDDWQGSPPSHRLLREPEMQQLPTYMPPSLAMGFLIC